MSFSGDSLLLAQINFDHFSGLFHSDKRMRDNRRSPRHEYSRIQLMAPLCDGEVTHISLFTPVFCNDVSLHGVSFFCPARPESDLLAILFVSAEERTLCLESRIVHVKSAYGNHRPQCLIACEFTGQQLTPKGELRDFDFDETCV